jgi:hypothetical protein
MYSAFFFQIVNAFITLLMLPLFLHYLNVQEYVIWSLFATFGGMLLQIEAAIQAVSIREISKAFNRSNKVTLKDAIARSNSAYKGLAFTTLIPCMILGIIYLNYFFHNPPDFKIYLAWIVFISAYSLNFYCGINNSILISVGKISALSNINSFTRVSNFLLNTITLKLGYSIIGISTSFLMSVILGVSLVLKKKSLLMNRFNFDQFKGKVLKFHQGAFKKYASYSLVSFLLYRCSLFIAASKLPDNEVAGFGLSLQLITFLLVLSFVPIQVWLNDLVIAINSKNKEKILREIVKTFFYANSIYIVGSIIIFLFGKEILQFFNSNVSFLNTSIMSALFVAFFVELNIALFASYLTTEEHYSYVNIYLATSFFSLSIISIYIYTYNIQLNMLIFVPLFFQSIVCLPLIMNETFAFLKVKPSQFFLAFLRVYTPK